MHVPNILKRAASYAFALLLITTFCEVTPAGAAPIVMDPGAVGFGFPGDENRDGPNPSQSLVFRGGSVDGDGAILRFSFGRFDTQSEPGGHLVFDSAAVSVFNARDLVRINDSDPNRVEFFQSNTETNFEVVFRNAPTTALFWVGSKNVRVNFSVVPEPAPLAGVALGLGFLAWNRRRGMRA